ncbi:unnamed protein product, partial [Ectocarpus fasciculatus]
MPPAASSRMGARRSRRSVGLEGERAVGERARGVVR